MAFLLRRWLEIKADRNSTGEVCVTWLVWPQERVDDGFDGAADCCSLSGRGASLTGSTAPNRRILCHAQELAKCIHELSLRASIFLVT